MTDLHTRIIDIIETEWLRPFDPNDSAGDTPGARAYDAARYVTEAVQDELDQRTAEACQRQRVRIVELETTVSRLQHDLDIATAAADPKKMEAVTSLVARATNLLRIERDDARARADVLAADLDHAERAHRRLTDQIRNLHTPEQSGPDHTLYCRLDSAVWPCRTRAAIDDPQHTS